MERNISLNGSKNLHFNFKKSSDISHHLDAVLQLFIVLYFFNIDLQKTFPPLYSTLLVSWLLCHEELFFCFTAVITLEFIHAMRQVIFFINIHENYFNLVNFYWVSCLDENNKKTTCQNMEIDPFKTILNTVCTR